MTDKTKYPHKRLIAVDDEILEVIRRYHYEHAVPSENQAIRELILAGAGKIAERKQEFKRLRA